MARTKFSELRHQGTERPGAAQRLAELRTERLEEIRLYELRHDEAGESGRAGRTTRGRPRSSVEATARRGRASFHPSLVLPMFCQAAWTANAGTEALS